MLSLKFKQVFIVSKKCVAKDHSAQLVGIANRLSDPSFGLVHRLSTLAFSKFKFCNVRRWSTASRNRSASCRLLLYLADSIFSLKAWHIGTLGETIAIRWYHGRLTEFDPPPKYIGGQVTEFLDVDVDRMSYFELRNYIKELGYIIDYNNSSDDEVEGESGSEGDTNEDTEVDSDVHQEYIEIRASKRHFKRSQIRSRGTTSDQINVDKKGPNIGYDETNIGIRESLVGKLGGDEPYYLSNEAPSFEIDDETGWGDGEEVDQVVHKPVRRKRTLNRVMCDETSKKIIWELGLVFGSVDEFRVAVTRYAV
uniref:PB1-like domain-containing protein n=1 Tax=Solanum tuberosum TaxID=4113 RepID=M1DJ23_SOLTU